MAIKVAVSVSAAQVTRLAQSSFTVASQGRGLIEISSKIHDALHSSDLWSGLVQIFVHHTSCSLLLCENADPTVCTDLERFFARLVPDGDPLFEHTAEGADDMPAHVRSVLTGASLAIPVVDGQLDLGTWQGVFLFEHRTQAHQRRVTVTLIGH